MTSFLVSTYNSSSLFNLLFTKLFLVRPADQNQVTEVVSKDEHIMAVLDDVTSLKKVKPIPTYFLIVRKLLCCASQKERSKPIDMAESRLDAHLDIVKLIKRQMM